MTDISTILDQAADLLEADGWCQGRLHEGNRHCALGSIERAVYTDGASLDGAFRDYLAAGKALSDYLGMGVVQFNDTEGRTAGEVVAAMRAAALLRSAAGSPVPVAA
jgi:hypothetical protein